MRTRTTVLLCLAAVSLSAAPSDSSRLVVHEWGTFLAMNGSDGVSLDGMYHEEHALPPFVHARSRDQLRLPTSLLKGETPVIYFYTPQPTRVKVHVGFPAGIWTQWYPQAAMVGPGNRGPIGLFRSVSPRRQPNSSGSWSGVWNCSIRDGNNGRKPRSATSLPAIQPVARRRPRCRGARRGCRRSRRASPAS